MKRLLHILICVISLLATACTEVMEDFNLNTAEAKTVVDAVLTRDRAYVILSKTTSYLNPNKVPYISGATITIAYNETILTLNEDSAGYYSIQSDFPVETMYELRVSLDNEVITAQSFMPKPVLWDSVSVKRSVLADLYPLPDSVGVLYEILGYITDTKGVANYYKLDVMKFDTLQVRDVGDDSFFEGQNFQLLTMIAAYKPEDTLWVYLNSIDKAAFEFYNTLALSNSSSGMFSAPDNPKSNLVGDALGRFYAYSVDSVQITFPKKEK